MATYIFRRILLMFPTLLGITFLIFMLIALSPGGIGASLRLGGAGGSADQTSASIRQAYLEDRYGLDDPAVVQYGRWLGRISPLKFGASDQIAPDGERVTTPKKIKPPELWDWFVDELPEATPAPPHVWPEAEWAAKGLDAAAIAQEKNREFRRVSNEASRARSAFINATAAFRQAVGAYVASPTINEPRAMTPDGKIKEGALRRIGMRTDVPQWAAVEKAGHLLIAAYKGAIDAREVKKAVFEAKPYPMAGAWIIPGVVSLSSPDFGTSFKQQGRPVMDMIASALPITLMLNFIAFPLIYLIAIPTGMLAAARRGKLFDVLSGGLFVALWSFPVVLAGVLAHGYLCNNEYLGWFPVAGLNTSESATMPFLPGENADGVFTRGWLLDRLWHCVLPVLCLVYTGFAVLAKQTRAAMLDNYNQDFVRTAKAKGVAGRDIALRHVFRNSLLPIITMFAGIFPAMLAGSVVIEKIFAIPGMGTLVINAINDRDRELLLATTLMTGAVNLLALLLADILYALADPRVAYD